TDLHNLVGLGVRVARVSGQHLPVVEHALREGLASGVGAQVSGEAERLVDGQVHGLHETRLRGQQARVQTSPRRRNDLTASSVTQAQL
ncbi:unnamed protein product, partial [Plutella xylostella]